MNVYEPYGRVCRAARIALWATTLALLAALPLAGATPEADEATPAQLYNEGTQQLRAGQLRAAEGFLQSALASQLEPVQAPALYNLGHVRFRQGAQELKDGPDANATNARARQASEIGDLALRAADAALASGDLGALVEAYMRGRGARKGLNNALTAVQRALESYGHVLAKWQRATGDFRSAHELRPADHEARFNAEVVDRHIARLVDSQQLMMKGRQSLSQQRQQLKDKMGKMKQKMPKELQQQCSLGEEDEDEDGEKQREPPKDLEEPKPKEGREMVLTPEEAARLLEMLRLDANRKLPLGVENSSQTKDRNRRNW